MNRMVVMTSALLLSACSARPKSTPEPIITTVEVAVPVAVGCIPVNMQGAPEYPDTDDALRAAPDAASRYQLLYAGRKVRVGRLTEIESVIASCPKASAQ